jgi:uncharacterized SAM-binding protein YcdF (DUF218 family)
VFFWLSKFLDFFFSPFCLSLLCALVAVFHARRGQSRRAWVFGWTAFLLAYLFSTSLVADNLMAFAERHDGHPFRPGQQYDAVIVLGGFASDDDAEGRVALSEGGERALRGYELLRSGQARVAVIAAGGLLPQLPVEADVVAKLYEQWGLARDRLLLGRTSVNTRQNALEVASLVRAHKLERLVLVTSAAHMQRALECMRAVGLDPDALPCDYHGSEALVVRSLFYPRASSLAVSEFALRELMGRLVYRLMGYAKPT